MWSLNCLYDLRRALQLRTESEVVCNFAKPSLLKRLTISNCVINENLVSFPSHCDDSCHESAASQSTANEICNKNFFLYLLTFQFYSNSIGFATIGQISMAVKEMRFHHL